MIAGIGAGDSLSRRRTKRSGSSSGRWCSGSVPCHDAVRAVHGNGVPVWVGGRARQVREIVTIADGWNAWGCAPQAFAREAAFVRELAPAAVLTWGGLVLLGADDAAARAKAATRSVGPDVIVGGPEQVAEQFRAYEDGGRRSGSSPARSTPPTPKTPPCSPKSCVADALPDHHAGGLVTPHGFSGGGRGRGGARRRARGARSSRSRPRARRPRT